MQPSPRGRPPPRGPPRGPGPAQHAAEGAGPPRRRNHRVHPGKEPATVGLVQPVLERRAHRVLAVGLEAGQEEGDPLDVEDGVLAGHGLGKHRPPLGGGAGHLGDQGHPAQPGRHGQRDGGDAGGAARGDGEATEERGGHVVGVALGARGQREEGLARQGRAEERVARHQAAHPGGRARAQAARGGDAVQAGQRHPLEWPAGGLVGQAHPAGHHVVLVAREPPGPLPVHAHADALVLARADLVVEGEGQAEGVEPRPEVGRGGGDADVDAHETHWRGLASAVERPPARTPGKGLASAVERPPARTTVGAGATRG